MKYLVYLKESLKRRPARHLTIFVIMTCALVLPLLFSIYLDSSEYGKRQELLSWTKGETFHIKNAGEEDCSIFADMEGLSAPYFEDGVIYMHILDDGQWQDEKMVDNYGYRLKQKIEQAGPSYLRVAVHNYYNAHGISKDPQRQNGRRIIGMFSVFVMALSALVIKSAYQSHLRGFRSDVGVLCSCGADNGQINAIFLVEFIFLFVFSAVSAVILSAVTMKLIFSAYMEISGVKGFSWVIFKMDPRNTALCVVAFGAVLLLVLRSTLQGNSKHSLQSMLREDSQTLQMKKGGRRKLSVRGIPEKTLSCLWKQRIHKVYRSCLFLSISIITIFLFLFGYLSMDIDWVEQPRDYELDIVKQVELWGGFTQEDIDFVEGLQNADHAAFLQERPVDFYAQQPEEALYVDRIRIKLIDPKLHRQTEEEIRRHFSGKAYEINNYQEDIEYSYDVAKGIYLMLLFLFCAMGLFMLIILYMKLYEYIDDCQGTIRTLSTIGASKEMIHTSFIRQAVGAALVAVIVPMILSTVLMCMVASSIEQKFMADIPLIAAYAVAGILTAGGYVLPVHNRLKQILKHYR